MGVSGIVDGGDDPVVGVGEGTGAVEDLLEDVVQAQVEALVDEEAGLTEAGETVPQGAMSGWSSDGGKVHLGVPQGGSHIVGIYTPLNITVLQHTDRGLTPILQFIWAHAGHRAQDSVIFTVSDTEQTPNDTTCNSTTEMDNDCGSVKLAFATSLPSNVSVESTDDTVAVPAHPMSRVIQERDDEMFTAGNWNHVQTVPATAVEEFDPADD